MRVAYVYYLATPNQIGIESKVRQQARAIAAEGLEGELDIIVLNPERNEQIGCARFVKYPAASRPRRYYDYLLRRYQLIERSLDLQPYDWLILRYPLADASGPDLTGKYRVITEHHANEPAELTSRYSPSLSPQQVARVILLRQERRWAAETLKHCRGLIAMTDEIGAFEQRRAGMGQPVITVANGIDVTGISATGFKRFDGRKLDLLFLGTSLRPWHGLERMIASINQYHGNVELVLHVVGNIKPESVNEMVADLGKTKFYGPMQGADLDALMAKMNLAVSTMALHRKGLDEACSLKTREYTARGIPFVLAYYDPDLVEIDEGHRFFLRFDNDDTQIDLEKVIEFAIEMSKRRDEVSNAMRSYALAHLDWRVKLRQYVAFVHRLAGQKAAVP